jgi:hypothetical protein
VAWILAATGYLFNFVTLSIAFFGGAAKTPVATWCAALLVLRTPRAESC